MLTAGMTPRKVVRLTEQCPRQAGHTDELGRYISPDNRKPGNTLQIWGGGGKEGGGGGEAPTLGTNTKELGSLRAGGSLPSPQNVSERYGKLDPQSPSLESAINKDVFAGPGNA